MNNIVWGTISKVNKDNCKLSSQLGEITVPTSELRYTSNIGDKILILCWKNDEGYLVGTEKIDHYLSDTVNIDDFEINQEIEGTVYKKTNIGYKVHFNFEYSGLLFVNEIFKEISLGDKINVFIKNIREDSKIDFSLHPVGFKKFTDSIQSLIVNKLKENGGELNLTDKSTPQEVSRVLGISKKKFKDAVGGLYKRRVIEISKDRIKFVNNR